MPKQSREEYNRKRRERNAKNKEARNKKQREYRAQRSEEQKAIDRAADRKRMQEHRFQMGKKKFLKTLPQLAKELGMDDSTFCPFIGYEGDSENSPIPVLLQPAASKDGATTELQQQQEGVLTGDQESIEYPSRNVEFDRFASTRKREKRVSASTMWVESASALVGADAAFPTAGEPADVPDLVAKKHLPVHFVDPAANAVAEEAHATNCRGQFIPIDRYLSTNRREKPLSVNTMWLEQPARSTVPTNWGAPDAPVTVAKQQLVVNYGDPAANAVKVTEESTDTADSRDQGNSVDCFASISRRVVRYGTHVAVNTGTNHSRMHGDSEGLGLGASSDLPPKSESLCSSAENTEVTPPQQKQKILNEDSENIKENASGVPNRTSYHPLCDHSASISPVLQQPSKESSTTESQPQQTKILASDQGSSAFFPRKVEIDRFASTKRREQRILAKDNMWAEPACALVGAAAAAVAFPTDVPDWVAKQQLPVHFGDPATNARKVTEADAANCRDQDRPGRLDLSSLLPESPPLLTARRTQGVAFVMKKLMKRKVTQKEVSQKVSCPGRQGLRPKIHCLSS